MRYIAIILTITTLAACATTSNKPRFPAGEWTCSLEDTHSERVVNRTDGCYDPNASLAIEILGFIAGFFGAPNDPPDDDDEVCFLTYELEGCGKRQLFTCRDDGACAPIGRRQVNAASDADCQQSPRCETWGECALAPEGRCRAGNDADCQSSTEACALLGLCSVGQGGQCVATDAGCRTSEACRDRGRCHADEGACWAASEDDCRASRECAERGRCWEREGICVAEGPR